MYQREPPHFSTDKSERYIGEMLLYGENVYYVKYDTGHGSNFPLYRYDIQKDETTLLLANGDYFTQYKNKLLLSMNGNTGGILDMDTGVIETTFSFPKFEDEILKFVLYKDKLFYFNGEDTTLILYDEFE